MLGAAVWPFPHTKRLLVGVIGIDVAEPPTGVKAVGLGNGLLQLVARVDGTVHVDAHGSADHQEQYEEDDGARPAPPGTAGRCGRRR